MQRRSDRLKRVQDLADTEERRYCRALGEAQRSLDEQQARLEELETYRRDYATRGGQGGSFASVHYADYRNFLNRLDAAVAAQSQAVLTSRQALDTHRERWLGKRRKSESLQRVVDRARATETREHELRLQKQQDDLPVAERPFDVSGRQDLR